MRGSPIKKTSHLAERAYIYAMQLHLLQRALAPWPRRSAPLLAINCGDGKFLKKLWQSGFDVLGAEANPDLRIKAERRDIPGLEILAASACHIPCEDDSFDWVILHLTENEAGALDDAIREALRLARRGMLATFWNRCSLAGAAGGGHAGKLFQPGISWWSVWKTFRGLEAGRITSMAALCGPVFTWRRQCPLSFMNSATSIAPLGAWCAIRLDLSPLHAGTPLALRLGKPDRQPAAAMEYSKKYSYSNASKS